MKRIIALVLALCMLLTFAACKKGGEDKDKDKDANKGSSSVNKADDIPDTCESKDGKYVIAMVTDVGQLKDKSFNQGTWDGVKLYANKNGKTYKYYQPANGDKATDDDRFAAFEAAISGGAEIIVTPGFLQEKALTKAAEKYPDTKFVFIDGYVLKDSTGKELKNIAAVSYHEEQCGYMAGYAAVVEGYTKLGFSGGGGGTNPAVNRYGYGFVQGIQDAAKANGVKAEVNFSFLYGEQYSASTELQTMLNGWYTNGIQCVFACGGSMCNSAFAAAGGNNGVTIGVDCDQSQDSETVITSAMKGLAESAQKILGAYFDGKWNEVGGMLSNLGVDDNAVGLPFSSSRFEKFTEKDYNAIVDSMKTGGTLTVKSDYENFLAGNEKFDNVTVNFVK
ncbi:MAG: BMP family ABC transporter substrate-binding protein [Clostridia bacterium]|nr:BMP family ABC transporter substrate-binding protein [Clostridia bacterium]